MNYREYFKASTRHLLTCNRLLNDVDANKNVSENIHYINEAYYLSGYVYECLLSYVLFYGCKTDVEQNQLYRGEFLTHNLPSKVKHVTVEGKKSIPNIIPLTAPSPDKDINKLFCEWSVESRYEPSKFVNLDTLKTYVELMNDVKIKIFNQYPL